MCGNGEITNEAMQKVLEENNQLLQTIMDFRSLISAPPHGQAIPSDPVSGGPPAPAPPSQNRRQMPGPSQSAPVPQYPQGQGHWQHYWVYCPPESTPPQGRQHSHHCFNQPPHGHTMPSDPVSGGPPAPPLQSQMNGQMPGPSQSAPGQYPNYPQGQGQQYGAYRPPQPGPPQGQQQRPYGYD